MLAEETKGRFMLAKNKQTNISTLDPKEEQIVENRQLNDCATLKVVCRR